MTKIKKSLIFIFVLAILIVPVLSFAQILNPPSPPSGGNLVPCNTTANPEPCDFDGFMKLVNNVLNFIFFKLVIPICAIMFAYAGLLLLTSFGEPAKRTKAKNIFTNVVIGLVIAAAAWLIVKLILSVLGYDGAWIGF